MTAKQDKIVEHLREYIQDLQDEQKWDKSLNKSQDKLIAAAKLAKQQLDRAFSLNLAHNSKSDRKAYYLSVISLAIRLPLSILTQIADT